MAEGNGFFSRLKDRFIRTADSEKKTQEKGLVRFGAEGSAAGLFQKKKRNRPFALAVLFTSLKLLIVAFVVLCFAGLGLAFGIGKAYIDTAPTLDVAQLTISDRTSFLYDKDGKLMTSIADVEYRDWVDIEDIPDMLQNAFIAVEDVRFYKHQGVDFKRLFSAALEILGNSNSSGGSTITQQLIKNKILGSQRNYKRKIQEAYLALELEKMIGKDEILEAYLNDIYLGQSNYGVKTAAKDYFGKELSELTVRECAMLAGLPQAPYSYDPRRNMYVRDKMEITNNRTDQVLERMYQAGYITKEQYESALREQVKILEVSEQKQMYDMAYFVELLDKVSDPFKQPFGRFSAFCKENSVIRIADRPNPFAFKLFVKFMPKNVSQQWRDNTSLRGADGIGLSYFAFFTDRCTQEFMNQRHNPSILNPIGQQLDELTVIHCVEELP